MRFEWETITCGDGRCLDFTEEYMTYDGVGFCQPKLRDECSLLPGEDPVCGGDRAKRGNEGGDKSYLECDGGTLVKCRYGYRVGETQCESELHCHEYTIDFADLVSAEPVQNAVCLAAAEKDPRCPPGPKRSIDTRLCVDNTVLTCVDGFLVEQWECPNGLVCRDGFCS